MKVTNNLILGMALFMLLFTSIVNIMTVQKLSEIGDDTKIQAKALYGRVSICLNRPPMVHGHNCSFPLVASYDGILMENHSCTIFASDPDAGYVNFSTNSSFASVDSGTGRITLSGNISENNLTRPNNISFTIKVTDTSGCANNHTSETIKMDNITYTRGQVLWTKQYPEEDEIQLNLKEGFTTYHKSLDDYFRDLDGLPLSYEHIYYDVHCFNIDIRIENSTNLAVYEVPMGFHTEDLGSCRAQFKATNPFGMYNHTNIFHIYVEKTEEEQEEQEEEDETRDTPSGSSGGAGSPAAYQPDECWLRDVECEDWGDCIYQPNTSIDIQNYSIHADGIMKRECTWSTNCPDEVQPDLVQVCDYMPNCFDSMRNCHEMPGGELLCEEGVDCGGPCQQACPTCNDGIQNQGEEGIDCGGPCQKACPTCSDGILNCHTMEGGKELCEEKIDCGGPCAPCPTCNDKIRNCHRLENGTVSCEEGIDCGGPCPECLTEDQKDIRNIVSITSILSVAVLATLSFFTGKIFYIKLFQYIQKKYMDLVKAAIMKRRDMFRKKYLAFFDSQIKQLIPDFDAVTNEETKKIGDALLKEEKNYNIDRYSVSFNNDYADVLTDNSIRTINYAINMHDIESGRKILEQMLKKGIKPNYRLCKRSSATLWNPDWGYQESVKYDKIGNKLVARTVEYILSFTPKDRNEAEKIVEILEDYAPEKEGRGFVNAKDIRITGESAMLDYDRVNLNVKSVNGQKLLVLTRNQTLPGFKTNKIWVNPKLLKFMGLK